MQVTPRWHLHRGLRLSSQLPAEVCSVHHRHDRIELHVDILPMARCRQRCERERARARVPLAAAGGLRVATGGAANLLRPLPFRQVLQQKVESGWQQVGCRGHEL